MKDSDFEHESCRRAIHCMTFLTFLETRCMNEIGGEFSHGSLDLVKQSHKIRQFIKGILTDILTQFSLITSKSTLFEWLLPSELFQMPLVYPKASQRGYFKSRQHTRPFRRECRCYTCGYASRGDLIYTHRHRVRSGAAFLNEFHVF